MKILKISAIAKALPGTFIRNLLEVRPFPRFGLRLFRSLAIIPRSRFFSQASVALAITLFSSCGNCSAQSLQRFEFSSAHMGTRFFITLFAPEQKLADAAAEAAFQRVAKLDDTMSDYKADSELVRLSESAPGQPVRASEDLFDILEQSQKFSKLSDGAFDITVGPLVRLWRFSRKRKTLPPKADVQAALKSVGYKNLRLDRKARTATLLVPGMRLDLGGIAKGYAADQALAVLKSKGLTRALVAASGDIAVGDPPPGQRGWRVEIEPLDASHSRPMLLLHNMGISTSGDIEQSIEIDGTRYSHIVSPTTGLGLTNRIQVTMLAPNATTTDALATGVSVLGPLRGMALVDSLPKTAALIFTKSGEQKQMLISKRFKKVAGPIINQPAP